MAITETPTRTIKDLDTVHPDWCAGCGDFGVLKSLKEASSISRSIRTTC